ncbi:AzlC family ABC transporter permease [Peptostreptococcus stomatis]|uniref:AzlC family ABC transporter permease n=1 Tax=Peptostreptococcus stomatis TaxID=341694 RepID=UPI0028E52599|nr:AzlC family ABC transporter permease [Peptostreptococcus stomatis]
MNLKKIKKALITALPIAFCYVSLGFIGGTMISKVGFNLLDITLITIFVFSGSAVFIASNMLIGGINPQISIYLTLTIIITNLRNTLYSSALVNDTKNLKGWKKIVFSMFIADETFAINKTCYENDPEWDGDLALYVNIFSCIFGLIGNLLGGFFGQIIDIPLDMGTFMMSSMFVILAVLQVKNKQDLFILFIAILVSFAVLYIYQGGLDLIIVALIVTSIGYFIDKNNENKKGRLVNTDER